MAPTTAATRRTLEKLPYKEGMAALASGGTRTGRRRRDKAAVNCKKHPKHRQSPGVCAVCLCEKLAQLASKREKIGGFKSVLLMVRRKGRDEDEDDDDDSLSSSPSSVSSYCSSSLGSSCSSPMHDKFYAISREAKGSSSSSNWSSNFFMNGKNVLLTKSRSLAFVPRNINNSRERRAGDAGDRHEKRSTGFWSKLTSRNSSTSSRHNKTVEDIQGSLVYSKTVGEIAV